MWDTFMNAGARIWIKLDKMESIKSPAQQTTEGVGKCTETKPCRNELLLYLYDNYDFTHSRSALIKNRGFLLSFWLAYAVYEQKNNDEQVTQLP